MMSIQIRKATLDDLPAIHAVHVASIGSHQCRRKYSNDYLERKIMSLNQDQYKLPILNCEVLVASVYSPSHSGESIAGFGRITTLGTVGHEIQWVFVHPQFYLNKGYIIEQTFSDCVFFDRVSDQPPNRSIKYSRTHLVGLKLSARERCNNGRYYIMR